MPRPYRCRRKSNPHLLTYHVLVRDRQRLILLAQQVEGGDTAPNQVAGPRSHRHRERRKRLGFQRRPPPFNDRIFCNDVVGKKPFFGSADGVREIIILPFLLWETKRRPVASKFARLGTFNPCVEYFSRSFNLSLSLCMFLSICQSTPVIQ